MDLNALEDFTADKARKLYEQSVKENKTVYTQLLEILSIINEEVIGLNCNGVPKNVIKVFAKDVTGKVIYLATIDRLEYMGYTVKSGWEDGKGKITITL